MLSLFKSSNIKKCNEYFSIKSNHIIIVINDIYMLRSKNNPLYFELYHHICTLSINGPESTNTEFHGCFFLLSLILLLLLLLFLLLLLLNFLSSPEPKVYKERLSYVIDPAAVRVFVRTHFLLNIYFLR